MNTLNEAVHEVEEVVHDALDASLDDKLPPRERRWLTWLRRAGWTLVALYFLAAVTMLALRFLVVPGIAEFKDEIAAAASRALGAKVTIDRVAAEWHGLHPRLELEALRIHDRRGDEALALPYVSATVAWRSIVARELRFRSLVLDRPDLLVRRDPQGRLFIAGLELRPSDAQEEGSGAADWLLRQGEIVIRDAQVEWRDEVRGAPPLKLERLSFVLENDGRHHRFALRAEPPREYASAIDLRGDMVGRTVEQLAEWDGRLYAAFDHVDLAAWKAWVDYPFEVTSGRGALRLWLAVDDRRLTELAADLALEDVAARFAPELEPLDLAAVYGQFGMRQRADNLGLLAFVRDQEVVYDAFARRLALVPRGEAAFAPADFTAQWAPAQGRAPESGELVARSIDLAPLALLSGRLPLPERLRTALATMAPEGRFTDCRFRWTGDVARPDTFSARGRFADIGMRPYGTAPGFAHLSGQFDFTERGGVANLSAARTKVQFAGVPEEDAIPVDALRARAQWTLQGGGLEVKVDDLATSSPDLAATGSVLYRRAADGAQAVDVALRASRMDGRAVRRYIPDVRADTSAWLKRGIVAAPLTDVRFRLRGDLDDFPYDDPKKGEFRAGGRVVNGTLDYAPGWPQLTGVHADLALEGRRMTITSTRAATYGIQVAKVTAIIPDLIGASVLELDGQTEGPLADYLRFIGASPVREFIDGATDGWSGDGRAKFALRLKLPLAALEKAQVAGTFQFAGNELAMGAGEAPLAQVNGTVEFSESSVTAKSLAAQTLGGNIAVQLAAREGATTAIVQGAVDAAQLVRQAGLPFHGALRGPLPFRFTETKRANRRTTLFESTLVGVAVDLPAPFAKRADESLPLRLERRPLAGAAAPQRESMTLSIGTLVGAEGVLRTEGGKTTLERAGVGLGDVGVQLPERPGVFVAGNLPTLDLDRLLPVLTDATSRSAAADAALTALNLRAGTLTVIGREFHDVNVKAQFSTARTWNATVDARELVGEVAWRPEGEGLVTARLKHLAHPEVAPDPMPGAGTATRLPALNVVADRYLVHGRDLGRLELDAVNERGGWRLQKLAVTAPEGSISAQGVWRPGAPAVAERTELEVRIRTDDAGRYLARFGHPDTIARGTAELDGKVNWLGPISAIDFPSLTGEVTLHAAKGQFVKVKPGIGKLLGVLSLQALPRRLTLDFNDIFSEGFAFDTIQGTASIAQGVARTQDLTMVGPAATVVLTGQADLARETQDLSVRVVPVVGDSVAAAAAVALLNPIVGLGALLAQRLLKDPLGQMLAFQYHVTGPWDDPRVERVGAATNDAAVREADPLSPRPVPQ
jgi:uncharacterized protein (TIGR02099 family)